MKLTVLGSSSFGNCYLLENDKECLILDAGIPFMEVKKALDFNVSKIVGVISTHIHNDHNKYLEKYKSAGIQAICFGKEIPEYDADKTKHYSVGMGNFRIRIFPLIHDVPCYGFYITHPEIGKLVYITDTECCKYRFKGLNHILVEANYSKELVERDSAKYEHQITGHMDIATTCRFLEANNNQMLLNVILCHLSGDCADPNNFIEQASKVVRCPIYVARKGIQVDLGLTPF